MTRRPFILSLVLFCIVLASCGGSPATKPPVIQDAESYTSDGTNAFAEADWYRAQWLFTRALSLYEGIDDQQGVLNSHINLAEVALSVRDYPTTLKHLDYAADIANKASLQHYQTRITLLYAQNALQQKQTTQAESILQSLLPEFDGATPVTIPDTIQMTAIANRTKIAFVQNQDEALWTQRYANSLKLSTADSPALEARLLRFQSDLLQRQGSYGEAEFNLQQALSAYKSSLSRPGIASTLEELGQLYMAQDRWQDAQDYLNRSIAVFRYLGDTSKVIETTESLIIVETKLGNLERSKALNQWVNEIKE